jgi:hypothetical protein
VITWLVAALALGQSTAISLIGPANHPTVRALQQVTLTTPKLNDHGPVLVVLDTSRYDWDELVPQARRQLKGLISQHPKTRFVLCLPLLPDGKAPVGFVYEVEGESEEKREKREEATERAEAPWYSPSLLAQAARELGIPTLDLEASSDHGRDWQGVRDAIEDLSPESRTDKKRWHLLSFTSEQKEEGPAANALDGDPATYWHSQYDPTTTRNPHSLVIDLGREEVIGGVSYLPRQDGGSNGSARQIEVYVSDSASEWGEPAGRGEFKPGTQRKRLRFAKSATGRFLKFVIVNAQNGEPYASAAEISLIGPLKVSPIH